MDNLIVYEASDSVHVELNGTIIAKWRHDESHEQFFKDLFAGLGRAHAYEEVY